MAFKIRPELLGEIDPKHEIRNRIVQIVATQIHHMSLDEAVALAVDDTFESFRKNAIAELKRATVVPA